MTINVKHVAKLANLGLSSEEEKKFEKQLASVLDYVGQLDAVDTSDVSSVAQITGLENVTRDDSETQISLSQEEVLANAQDSQNGFFKVKAVLEKQDTKI